MRIHLGYNSVGIETFYILKCNDRFKKAGWFYFLNTEIDSLENRVNFLWHRYQESFSKRNPFVNILDVQKLIKNELIYDFNELYNCNLSEISLLANNNHGSGAYEILEENPIFTKTDLNRISQCLQKSH